MSSGTLTIPKNTSLFLWNDDLLADDYLIATYQLGVVCDPLDAALGMAMEQCGGIADINGYVSSEFLSAWSVRVHALRFCNENMLSSIQPYFLQNDVYRESPRSNTTFIEIDLAFPLCLLTHSPTQWLNVLIGELPRLGFITSFRLINAKLPKNFGPGPGFGISGILKKFNVNHGPLLCRAMRPAVGLNQETMARLSK